MDLGRIINRELYHFMGENENIDEDYPSSFDMDHFKSLTSYAARKQYADQHLPKIGSGSARHVYVIDNDKVLKLAANRKGLEQNRNEASLGNDQYFSTVVAKIIDYHPDDLWIESERAKKIGKARFQQLTGFKIENVDEFFRNFEAENKYNGKPIFFQEPELKEKMWDDPFISQIAELMQSYDHLAGDYGRISSYGEVNREGQPDIVLIDYGLTKDTWNEFYHKSRKPRYAYEADTNMGDELDNFINPAEIKDCVYAGVLIQSPEKPLVGETIENYKDVSERALVLSVKYVENLKEIIQPKGNEVSTLYKVFQINKQNIDKALSIAKSDIVYYENLMKLKDYLKNFGLIKEDLVYWHVDGDASPESDSYSIVAEGIEINNADQIINNIGTLKPQIAQAAQQVYDQWDQDEEGHSEEYGGGGICDDISEKISEVLINHGYSSTYIHNENFCHTAAYVVDDNNKMMIEVDISPYNYEQGTAYTWKKIPDVQFTPEMVEIKDMSEFYDDYMLGENTKPEIMKVKEELDFTGKGYAKYNEKIYIMSLKDDEFVHFTKKDLAQKIISDGKISFQKDSHHWLSPVNTVFAVSLTYGKNIETVQQQKGDDIVAIKFKTNTPPAIGFVEEVKWRTSINLINPQIISVDEAKYLIKNSPYSIGDDDNVVYKESLDTKINPAVTDETVREFLYNSKNFDVNEDGTSLYNTEHGSVNPQELDMELQEMNEDDKEKKTKADEVGTLMVMYDIPNWDKLLAKIKPNDVYMPENKMYGLEDEPHVTVLYGFNPDVEPEDMYEALKNTKPPFKIKVKGISVFNNMDFDVVKLDIESPQLEELRKVVENLPNSVTFRDYHPHMTIAYVLRGRGNKYKYEFKKPLEFESDDVVFSDKNRKMFDIDLSKDVELINERIITKQELMEYGKKKPYQEYSQEIEALEEYKKNVNDKFDSYYNNVKRKYFSKYISSDLLDKITNQEEGWWDIQNKVFDKMNPKDSEDYSKGIKKARGQEEKIKNQILKKKIQIENKYRGSDYYGLKGDVNSPYLYHITTTDNANSILYDNEIYGGGESYGISTTTNKNLVKDTKPVFYNPSQYSVGVTAKNLSTTFVLDFNKIKADGIKYRQGDDDDIIGTNFGEEEIKLYPKDDESLNLNKYLVKVIYDPSKENNKDTEAELFDLLKNKNIKYFIVNNNNKNESLTKQELARFGKTEEGVGDKYAQRVFNIPDTEQEFNRDYDLKNNKEKEEIIIDLGTNKIIKNIKNLKNVDCDVRGVIDNKGDLFVQTSYNYGMVHTDLVNMLAEKGYIKNNDVWWSKPPSNFLTIQRNGCSNDFYVGESNVLYGNLSDLNYNEAKKQNGNLPPKEELPKYFNKYMDLANANHPNINFLHKKAGRFGSATVEHKIVDEDNESIKETEVIENNKIKTTPEIKNYVSKFSSDEELLRSGGVPTDLLDIAAFGFSEESVKQLMPKQLNIRWNNDLENVKEEIERSGLSEREYAKKVDLSEPIEVDYWKDDKLGYKEGFYIQDGHHRYYAALILNKPLNVDLTIKTNPITKLSDLGYDEFHRELWHQVKGTERITNEAIIYETNLTLNDLPFKRVIEKNGGKIYSVGGAVRDEFLGKESKDLDILITGIPLDKIEQLITPFGKVDAVGKSFGILKFKPQGSTEDIDIAIPRSETVKSTEDIDKEIVAIKKAIWDDKGKGDEDAFFKRTLDLNDKLQKLQKDKTNAHKRFDVQSDHELPIEADLKRRDFTINAIAKDISGNIIDPFGGTNDLRKKIIRVVNPEAFSDDPLRMLRAVQFASRFGFDIDDQTMELIKQNASKIREIASERVLEEFKKIVTKGDDRLGVQLLKDTGLFKEIFGFEIDQSTIDRSPFEEANTMGEFIFLMTRLLNSPSSFYRKNLNGDIDTVKEIKALELAYEDVSDDIKKNRVIVHNAYSTYPEILKSKILPESLSSAINDLASGAYPKTLKDLSVNGNDMMELGLNGKEIGDALKGFLIKIYFDKVRNDKNELISLIKNNQQTITDAYEIVENMLLVNDAYDMVENMLIERDIKYMPNSDIVTVNKNCQLGGKGDGTSDACNQGEMKNLTLTKIEEEDVVNSERPYYLRDKEPVKVDKQYKKNGKMNEDIDREKSINIVWKPKIENYKKNLENINFELADKYRDGAYTKANEELAKLEAGEIEYEDVFYNPDSPLRNMIILSGLDARDYRTSKI